MTAWDIGLVAQERVDSVGSLAAAAESLGFGGIWVADSQHVFRDPGPRSRSPPSGRNGSGSRPG